MVTKIQKGRSNLGDVAQLGEHYTCTVGVVGSNPIISTRWSLKTGIKPPASVTGYDH